MNASTDIVLGYIHRYTWADVWPFVHSLRRSGYRGEVHFFGSGLSAQTLRLFQANGVGVSPVRYPTRRMRNRFVRAWPLLRRLPEPLARRALRAVANFTVLRYLLYERFLAARRGRYRAVLLADVRDVWFQSNPLAGEVQGVHVFEETDDRTIASEPSNTAWIRKAYGEAELSRLGGLPILCSGTILGEASALEGFLGHFRSCLLRARSLRPMGVDQGVFNYAVRTGCPTPLTIHRNGRGPVLTMAILPPDQTRCDAEGRLVRPDGSVIPLLHQYDRHPAIAARLRPPPASADGPGPEGARQEAP